MSGLIGRIVRGQVNGGEMMSGEVVSLTASEAGSTLYIWIVDGNGVLRCISDGGYGVRTVVLPRDSEGPIR